MSGPSHPHHPNGSSGKPVLPPLPMMNPQEREMWMVSHRAPDGMLMVHQTELARMQDYVQALSFERATLVRVLGALCKPDEPPVKAIQRLLETLKQVMEKVAELEKSDERGKEAGEP